MKSGISIVHEAQNAESKTDFIHKFKIVAKEVEETKYWLILCGNLKTYPSCEHLVSALHEIDKIVTKLYQQVKPVNWQIVKLTNCRIGMEHYNMNLTLKVWRQRNSKEKGKFETYKVDNISSEMSFLEMFDVLNEKLITEGKEPIAFDHDCREGICGMCSMYINGKPHGPWKANTVCQLHMRAFKDGDTIVVEPWRAKAFPVIKDLCVDRSAFDRIIQAGGFISVNTGNAVDANAIPVEKENADKSFAAAACIGCGACVAACKNSSAMLFVSAKVAHLALLPQGDPERKTRVVAMINQMDKEGFGACTNINACEAACPKEILVTNIGRLNHEYMTASFTADK